MILSIEDVLRYFGIHKQLIHGSKTVKPNEEYKGPKKRKKDGSMTVDSKEKKERGSKSCTGLINWIYLGFKELNRKYQLRGRGCYNALENIQEALKCQLVIHKNIILVPLSENTVT